MRYCLEYTYFLVRKIQKSSRYGEPRFGPMVLIGVTLMPAVQTLLRLIFAPSSIVTAYARHQSRSFYGSADRWFYAAIVTSYFLSWLFFDRRRRELDEKFRNFPEKITPINRVSVFVFSFTCISFFWYMNKLNYILTIPAFFLVTILASSILAWFHRRSGFIVHQETGC